MMPLRKNSTTIIMMMENTTMRKPERSSGTLNVPPNRKVSLSRKRSHHSLHATNRKLAMHAARDGADAADDHDQQDLIGHAGFEGVRLQRRLVHCQQRAADTRKERG